MLHVKESVVDVGSTADKSEEGVKKDKVAPADRIERGRPKCFSANEKI